LQAQLNSLPQILFFITPRREPHRKHRHQQSLDFCVWTVEVTMYRYSVSPSGWWLLSSNGCCLLYFEVCLATGQYVTIYTFRNVIPS
jgi:hypothetical protein